MPTLNPTLVLRGFQTLHGVLSLVMAQLSRTLIRESLIPERQAFLGDIGALFILVSLLFTFVFWSKLEKHLRKYAIIACVALIFLLLFQIFFIVTLENYGNPPATHRFLVGFQLTEQGRTWVNRVGAERSKSDHIKDIGSDRIDEMYGYSYGLNATVYSLSYLAFVFGVVMTLGGILKLSGETINKDERAGTDPPDPATG